MRVTKVEKFEFPHRADDLYTRGAWIIRESVEYGITATRAHVEVDISFGCACLEAAQKLQDGTGIQSAGAYLYHLHLDNQYSSLNSDIWCLPKNHYYFFPHDAAVSPELSLLTDATLRHSVTLIGSEPLRGTYFRTRQDEHLWHRIVMWITSTSTSIITSIRVPNL